MTSFNLADLFFTVAATVPQREALVCIGTDSTGGRGELSGRRADYELTAARVHATARLLEARGIGPGDLVGLHLRNSHHHVESALAAFACRAVPCNLNHRYVADELSALIDDAGLSLVLCEPDLVDVATEAAADATRHCEVIAVDEAWERSVSAAVADGPVVVAGRSGDDLYLLFTGGTTGMPKGVCWRHEDIYQAALGGRGSPSRGVVAVDRPDQVVERALGADPIRRRLPFCPLIHGGASWITLQSLLSGGTAVLCTDRHFDARVALDLLASERIELTMLIGDATASPIASALEAEPHGWDLGALAVIASGGAVLSPSVADRLSAQLPGVRVLDTFGASESGGQGRLRRAADNRVVLVTDDASEVLDDALRPVAPGSVGRLARRGHVPLRYHNDPERTAATFPVVDGVRWSLPGDLARREPDGSITVLGRGSTCINTGGEKVFPEEVEKVVKGDSSVADCLVLGAPDERFGQRVAAVVSLRDVALATGTEEEADTARAALVARLEAHCRNHLAGYKVPRQWRFVDQCARYPTGKPDYAWAREVVAGVVGGGAPEATL